MLSIMVGLFWVGGNLKCPARGNYILIDRHSLTKGDLNLLNEEVDPYTRGGR